MIQPAADDMETLQGLSVAELRDRLGRATGRPHRVKSAARRLTLYGPNALPEEKAHPLLRLLSYFWGPIPWMIEAAVILSAVVRHWEDVGIISALLLDERRRSASGRSSKPATRSRPSRRRSALKARVKA